MKYNTYHPLMVDNNKNLPKPEEQKVVASPDKIVPKFCTGVNFVVVNNKYVSISLTFNEPKNPPVLIDRILVDLDHAKKISEVLNDLLAKIKK